MATIEDDNTHTSFKKKWICLQEYLYIYRVNHQREMCYDTYLFIGIQQAFLSITIPEFQVSSTKQCVTVTILKILKKPVGSCMLHHWGWWWLSCLKRHSLHKFTNDKERCGPIQCLTCWHVSQLCGRYRIFSLARLWGDFPGFPGDAGYL